MAIGSFVASFILAQTSSGTLEYKSGEFLIPTGAEPVKVAIDPGVVPMNTSTGRLWLPVGRKVLTFDKNGIGIRFNNKATFYKLEGIPTSPKVFSISEIKSVVKDTETNSKKLSLSAISGWVKVGNKVYLLARWEDSSLNPWLETLIEFNLSDQNPKPVLLGKFNGYSKALGQVNDKLVLQGEDLSIATFTDDGPAIATYSIPNRTFGTQYLKTEDTPPTEMKLIENSRFGISFRKTAANTILVGVINSEAATHEIAAEVRGSIIDIYSPTMLVTVNEGRKNITNLLTGAQIIIPNDAGIASTSQGLLLWTPKQAPSQAALYTFGSFRTISRWSK